MMASTFEKTLENSVGKKVKLRINNNRSTMLSVRWESKLTNISMHKMFLDAPDEVMQNLIAYLKREHKKMAPALKSFISEKVNQLDYSHQLDLSTLVTKGSVYDLKDVYDAVNHEYFDNSLDLYFTWFGQKRARSRARMTFGLYQEQLRLIKIHRRLDDIRFPEYFVTFVMYHEMLHHVCRPYVDENGYQRIHTKEFKQREKLFRYYDLATHWLKKNQESLFNDYRGFHGWT